jgi:hypothetical protein
MTPPTPLPRRYQRDLREVMEELQRLARHCRTTLSSLTNPSPKLERTLLELEARLYRLCNTLLGMETSAHCDACPHQQTGQSVQGHLLLCAQQLEALAHYLRSQVPAGVTGPGHTQFSRNGIVEMEPEVGSAVGGKAGGKAEQAGWMEAPHQLNGWETSWT